MATKPTLTVGQAVEQAGRGNWEWYLRTVADIQRFHALTLQTDIGQPDITPTLVYLHDEQHPLGTYVGDIWWDGAEWDNRQLNVPVDSAGSYSWASA